MNKQDISPFWKGFLGLLVFYMIGFIPVFGWIILKLAALLGFGGVLLTLVNSRKSK